MSPTCRLKTFYEYKALISFKFANKDSLIWNFLKIPHELCKHNIWFLGEFPFRKGKVSCYWIIIFLCRVIKIKFYWFIAAFFLKDKKLKKLAVALKFLYFLTDLILNLIFFASLITCKDPSPLSISSKRRNYLKPENFETFFCYQH